MKIVITNIVALNVGDGAILLGIVAVLRRAFGDPEIVVLDPQPDVARRMYSDLRFDRLVPKAVPVRFSLDWLRGRLAGRGPRLFRRAPTSAYYANSAHYADADLVVNSGGTFLVEHYDIEGRFHHMSMAVASGTPTIMFTQSLGPFAKPRNLGWVRLLIPKMALVLLRDPLSLRHLREAGVAGGDLRIVPDAAFVLAEPATLEAARARALPPRPRVAVSVRGWGHFAEGAADQKMDQYRRAVARTVERLVREWDAEVVFLSTCQGVPEYRTDDSKEARVIASVVDPAVADHVSVNGDFHDPLTLRDLLAGFDLVIATRMHMAILSLCAGTPVFPIAYEFKTKELFAGLGQLDDVADIETATADTLPDQVIDFVRRLPEARKALFAAVLDQHRRATEVADLLPPLVGAGNGRARR